MPKVYVYTRGDHYHHVSLSAFHPKSSNPRFQRQSMNSAGITAVCSKRSRCEVLACRTRSLPADMLDKILTNGSVQPSDLGSTCWNDHIKGCRATRSNGCKELEVNTSRHSGSSPLNHRLPAGYSHRHGRHTTRANGRVPSIHKRHEGGREGGRRRER